MKTEGLADALGSGVVTVMFTKKNGEERTLRCTFDPNLIPYEKWANEWKSVEEQTENNGPAIPPQKKQKPAGLYSVYDVDLGEWRSFYKHSVIQWK